MTYQRKDLADRGASFWRARRQVGLERKQAAYLLGHRAPDAIARYERGETEPTLDNAIKLAILYSSDLEALFPHKYEAFRSEVLSRVKTGRLTKPEKSNVLSLASKCSWEEALDDPASAEFYSPYVRSHVTSLAKRLAGL